MYILPAIYSTPSLSKMLLAVSKTSLTKASEIQNLFICLSANKQKKYYITSYLLTHITVKALTSLCAWSIRQWDLFKPNSLSILHLLCVTTSTTIRHVICKV